MTESINLSDTPIGRISDREKAEVASIRTDTWVRACMAAALVGLFIFLNWQVMNFVGKALQQDAKLLAASQFNGVYKALITPEVVMALITATAVQLGAAIITIVGYLFPKPRG